MFKHGRSAAIPGIVRVMTSEERHPNLLILRNIIIDLYALCESPETGGSSSRMSPRRVVGCSHGATEITERREKNADAEWLRDSV